MELIHHQSPESTKEELDLFTVEPTQTSILDTSDLELSSITTDLTAGPIEFYYAGSSDKYLDVASTRLYIKCKITKADGTDLTGAAKSTTVNNILHSLFSQADVFLNDRLLNPSIPTYPYKSYLETLLNFDDPAQKSQLTASGWYRDTAGKFKVADPTKENDGANERFKLFENGNVVELMGRPHCNLFFQHKLLLPGVSLKLRLTRARDPFVLMSEEGAPDLKLTIEESYLYVKTVSVSPPVILGHAKALEKTPAKYSMRRSQVTSYTISAGSLTSSKDNLFIGVLPRKVIVGLVSNKAYAGDLHANPFEFAHFNTSYMSISVNGRTIPTQPLTFNFKANQYMRGFVSLYANTDRLNRNEGCISRKEYPNGYFLNCFTLAPDHSEGSHFDIKNTGTVKLDLHFAEALSESVTVIVYAVFDSVVEINKHRAALIDYM